MTQTQQSAGDVHDRIDLAAPSDLDRLSLWLREHVPADAEATIRTCTELDRAKRAAADDLARAYESYRTFRDLRNRSLGEIGAAKGALNRATQEGRPPSELRQIAARIAELEEPAARALHAHDALHGNAVARFLDADARESQLAYETVCAAHGCMRHGDDDAYHDRLRMAQRLNRCFADRDQALLGRVIDEHSARKKSGSAAPVRTVTLWDTLSSKAAEDRVLESRKKRQAHFQAIEAFFESLRANGPPAPGPADIPAAIGFEPAVGDEGAKFHEQVVVPGLAQVFVPDWRTRVLVPLELEDALSESMGKTLYMTPGSGSLTSNALSSTTAAMDICRESRRWSLLPVLVDCPHHAFGPFAPELRDKHAVVDWLTDHLARLERRTGHRPVYAGRSTGGLLGLEIARYAPSSVACVIALSPPSPGADWQEHMARFYNAGELDAPDLHGYGWFNGGAALAQLHAAAGTPELAESRDAPSVRQQLESLRTPLDERERALSDRPTALILYGMDDTAQYPDRAELFRELSFPNLPLHQVWAEAEARFEHVRTIALPGGHFQFPIDRPFFRRLARDLVRQFVRDPRAFRRDRADDADVARFFAELDVRLQPLLRVRALKLALWDGGCAADAIVATGATRLDDAGDHEALELWELPEMRDYLSTRPGMLL